MTDYGTPNITQIEGSTAGKRIRLMLVGAVIVLLIIAAYFFAGRTHPIASGDVDRVFLYSAHHEGTAPASAGTTVATKPEVEDNILVLAQVKLRNISDVPLTLVELEGWFTTADGEQRSVMAGEDDFKRVFLAYPALGAQKREPLLRGGKIMPGQEVSGEAIFHFPGTRQQWDARKAFNVTATFDRNPPLTMVAR